VGDGLDRERVEEVPHLGLASEQELEVGLFRGEEGRPGSSQGGGTAGAPVISPLEVDPLEVGMDPAMLATVDSLILQGVADSASPGAALAVGRKGRLVRLRGYGRLDWGVEAPPATPSSLWDMASVTKVTATTTAAMILAEAGRLDLDAPVVTYLPWWSAGDPRKNEVTVRQLLLHRAGLPPFRQFYLEMEGRDAYRRAIGDLPLEYAPGDSTVYSDIGLMTVGFAVEAITGQPLDEFLQERVWGPLGMQDTGFLPDSTLLPRIAPTEVDENFRHEQVHGVVHDENAYAMGGVAGHAGLFSSARDMAVFAQTLLGGGSIGPCSGGTQSGIPCSAPRPGPIRIVAPTTVELFTRRYDETSSRALGWDTPSEGSSGGDYLTSRAFGHTGFTGTSIWVDPELDLFVIFLTSRTNPTRENSRHVALRRAVHDGIAQAILDRPVIRRER
jgi:CubicO group peptidase (beta-lactamase class C family)